MIKVKDNCFRCSSASITCHRWEDKLLESLVRRHFAIIFINQRLNSRVAEEVARLKLPAVKVIAVVGRPNLVTHLFCARWQGLRSEQVNRQPWLFFIIISAVDMRLWTWRPKKSPPPLLFIILLEQTGGDFDWCLIDNLSCLDIG